jgi:hypothetical protein
MMVGVRELRWWRLPEIVFIGAAPTIHVQQYLATECEKPIFIGMAG